MKQQEDFINSEIEHQKKEKKLNSRSTSKALHDVGRGPHSRYKIKQDRPQPLTSCRPDSICPGVTVHILSTPRPPTPPITHTHTHTHTHSHSPATWQGWPEWTCEAQAFLQAKVCKYTTEPRRKGRGLGESSRDATSFKKSERWACP